ncbi:MAG TPA: aminotransferase class III-fold pyridoxal phosphate-dependent enzyme [Planctomycetes bacterium]|nr:aminotransferase class III-fold pyridoxal phosphate-dependent enzyme [Planctomycetota bacterium]
MSKPEDWQPVIEHAGEAKSNEIRQRLDQAEPRTLRTYTPSLAVLAHSAGSYHWTPEGRQLADFSSGVLVANLGHNPRSWWQAVWRYLGLEQVDESETFVKAAPLTAYNAVTELGLLASERLLTNMRNEPGGQRMEQVLWAASGSEAIQKAIWAAMKRRPGQEFMLATRGGFHGKKGLAGAITGSEEDSERDPRVRFISFPRDECSDVQTRQQPLDLEPYRQELEQLQQELGDQICCLVTEPYLGGGGSFHPQKEYLQLLQQYCRDHDWLFILDEIQSNFGRTGPMYAYTHYQIEPDIVCLGKGLGNGVPVSAAVGREDVFGQMKYGEGSDTWSANPLSSAAVLATLDAFESEPVVQQGQQLSTVIEAGLQRLKETGIVQNVRGEGCVWGVECNACGELAADDVANACVAACYLGDDQGRAIHLLGPLAGKVIRVSPPLVMPLEEAQTYLDVMFNIFQQVADSCQG